MSQAAYIQKHHTPSAECQELGVAFVLGVSALIDDQLKPTEYGEFYKQCKLDNYHPGEVPRRLLENEMLCVLMCCCAKHPGQGNQKNVYQGCVKDILDKANEVKRGRRKLPLTRFLAEPSINMELGEVGRGQMNPGGPQKQSGQHLKRPDVGILKQVPMVPPAGSGTIVMDDFERFVEMKFPTEPQNVEDHRKQLRAYFSWGKDLTLMTTDFNSKNSFSRGFSLWGCNCTDKERKNLLERGEVYSAQEELDRQQAVFQRALDVIAPVIPVGIGAKILKGLGSAGKILLPAGI